MITESIADSPRFQHAWFADTFPQAAFYESQRLHQEINRHTFSRQEAALR
jgi:hypothetical protein